MKIEKVTAKPPVFEAVQQRYDNVRDIKKWLDAESVSIASEMSEGDEPVLEVTYHVRRENHNRTLTLKIYDVSYVDEFCGNDWIIHFGDGIFEVRTHGDFRREYDIKNRVLPTMNQIIEKQNG